MEVATCIARRDELLAARPALLLSLTSDAPVQRFFDPTVSSGTATGANTEMAGPGSAQNTLLVLGGGLLALAALVFAAVTYSRLGVSGRAAVLFVLTLAAALGSPFARSRGLTSTAETAAGVTVALTVLDAWAARHAGFVPPEVRALSWYASAAAIAAVLGLVHGRLTGARVTTVAGVIAAHLPVLFLLSREHANPGVWAVALSLVAAADMAACSPLSTRDRAGKFTDLVRQCAVVAGIGFAAIAVLAGFACAGTNVTHDWTLRVLCVSAFALLTGLAFRVADTGFSRTEMRAVGLLTGAFAVDAAIAGTTPNIQGASHALVLGALTLAASVWCWFRPGTTRSARFAGSVLLLPAGLAAAAGYEQGSAFAAAGALAVMAAAGVLFAVSDNRPNATAGYAFGTATKVGAAAAALPLHGDQRPFAMAGIAVLGVLVSQTPGMRRALSRGLLAGSATTGLAAWWTFLGLHHTTLVEAYSLPFAVALIGAGWAVRRALPATTSGAAYGLGLAVLLGPTALLSLQPGSEQLLRALLLLTGATVVLLAGINQRLSAPVFAGTVALAIAAVRLLAPVADAAPRWMSLGLAGALLLGLGATYEARRRDLNKVRSRLAQMA